MRTWLIGFIRPLDSQLAAFQEQSNTRIEGMGRIQSADSDLVARLEELKGLAADVERQLDEWAQHQERLAARLDIERQPSLA